MFGTQQCLFVVGSVLPKIDEISGHCKQTASNHTEQLASTKKYIHRLQLHDSCAVCTHQVGWCILLLKSIRINPSKTWFQRLQLDQLHNKLPSNNKYFNHNQEKTTCKRIISCYAKWYSRKPAVIEILLE